jgi:zinc protease
MALVRWLVLLLFLTSCRGDVGALGINLELEREVLSNGLVVILVEDHTVPVVSYQTWYRVGSVDEKPGLTGIAHLFEHLMFKGTPKYGPKEFFLQLEAKGAEVNAFTTRDYTVYYESMTSKLLPQVIDMEADRMANLILDDAVLQTERQVVFEERRLRTDNSPTGKMQEALWSQAYVRHPYQWPVIGLPEDLLRITVEDLRAFFKAHYQPANATVIIVGDFEPKSTLELIKKSYGGIPGRPRPERTIPKEPEQNEERRLVLYDQVASERFSQAYHITSASDNDTYALDVLSNILFEGESSRANRSLVEEKDISLGVSGSSYTPTYPGLLLVSGTMKGGLPTEQAEAALDQVVSEVQDKGVTQEEIDIAVRQLTVQLVDSVRTPHGKGQLIGSIVTIFGSPRRFAEDLEKYTQVTREDVKRVARKYLIQNNRSIVILKPAQSKPAPTKEAR